MTLAEVAKTMTSAIKELERIYLDQDHSADTRIRAVNSLASLGNCYAKVLEVSDLEARIEQLEIDAKR